MQKFKHGDLVLVTPTQPMPPALFEHEFEAIVIGNYADEYGGDNRQSYIIYSRGAEKRAWYHEDQLNLIESGHQDTLREWVAQAEEVRIKVSNLDWIFENGPEVLTAPHGASIQALFTCLGGGNLWGRNGEGWAYYENSQFTLAQASPYLKRKDKEGWLRDCEALQASKPRGEPITITQP